MIKRIISILLFVSASVGYVQAQNQLCFQANEDKSSFSRKDNGGNNPDIQYSTDGGQTWKKLSESDTIALAKKGDKVYLRGNNPSGFSTDWNKYTQFTMAGSISASGSVMSLIDNEGKITQIPCEYCFLKLFSKCENLKKAPELPAKELTARCYEEMFWNCTNLEEMPKLPATIMKNECYKSMFSYCTSLEKANSLPAITLADGCYESMFSYCYKLKQAPLLPAKKLKQACYKSMFWYCSELEQAPKLPAKELKDKCYKAMFGNCAKLQAAPFLPAKKMAAFCYSEMFSYCKSLTIAPNLNATSLEESCYKEMFLGCTSLNHIKVKFKKWSDATKSWVSKVEGKGTFICPSDLKRKHGENYIPLGWNVSKK